MAADERGRGRRHLELARRSVQSARPSGESRSPAVEPVFASDREEDSRVSTDRTRSAWSDANEAKNATNGTVPTRPVRLARNIADAAIQIRVLRRTKARSALPNRAACNAPESCLPI